MMEESKHLVDDEVLSSEDEQERIEEEKEKFTATVTVNREKITGGIRNVLMCQPGNAQSLTKILFDGRLTEAGKAEVVY
jgi:hypothetical protein